MRFEKVIAYPIWPNSIKLQWEIDNSSLVGNYGFKIEFSGSRDGPWEVIFDKIYNKYNIDIAFHLLNNQIFNQIFIKITGVPPEINHHRQWAEFSHITNLYQNSDKRQLLMAHEIVRKENLRFREFVGRECYILKKKYFGEKCNKCIDVRTNTITNSQCNSCFGTRFVGGYFNPVKLWAELEELPVQKVLTNVDTTEDKYANIRLSNEVIVGRDDIILDIKNNTRWKVVTEPTLSYFRSFPVSQAVRGRMFNSKAVENKISLEKVIDENRKSFT